MSEERRRRINLSHPWAAVDPADRWRASEMAADIIFADRSAVTWTNDAWKIDCSRMARWTVFSDAAQFVIEQRQAALREKGP